MTNLQTKKIILYFLNKIPDRDFIIPVKSLILKWNVHINAAEDSGHTLDQPVTKVTL